MPRISPHMRSPLHRLSFCPVLLSVILLWGGCAPVNCEEEARAARTSGGDDASDAARADCEEQIARMRSGLGSNRSQQEDADRTEAFVNRSWAQHKR